MSTTQRDELAREIFLADNAGQSREASLKDWAEYNFATEQSYAHNIADGLIAAGYGKLPTGEVWHSTPEPEGVQVVNDDTDNEGEDQNRWARTTDGYWKGYKDGGKTYLEWAELERRWGPITW